MISDFPRMHDYGHNWELKVSPRSESQNSDLVGISLHVPLLEQVISGEKID
jgi:hypothetical protein